MAEMLGLGGPSELVGSSIMRWVVETERDLVRDRVLRRQSGEEQPRVYEYNIRRVDGEIRTLEASVSLISYMGRPASLAFNHDVTERKRAEAENRAARARDSTLTERTIS
jgi:PAS domain S-box-containing protein